MFLDIILTALGVYICGAFVFVAIKMLFLSGKEDGLKGVLWTITAICLVAFAFISGGTLGYY